MESLLVGRDERSEFWMLFYVALYVFISLTLVAWQFLLDAWRLVPNSLSHLHTRVPAYAPRKLYDICVTRKILYCTSRMDAIVGMLLDFV